MASLEGAIKFAVAWEEDAMRKYIAWGGETSNFNAKKLFRNLARMEARHISLLRGIDVGRDIDVRVEATGWLDLSRDMTSYPTTGDRELKHIFEYALSKEEDSMRRYASLAQTVGNGKLRGLFTRLVNEERYHKTLLREQYNRLLKPY
jgi:rubrerythrin